MAPFVRPAPPSIAGVETRIAAFVGPTRGGPVGVVSPLISSLAEFERNYGGAQALQLADVPDPARRLNFMAHAVQAYFQNGGSQLHVVRTMRHASAAAGVLIDAERPFDSANGSALNSALNNAFSSAIDSDESADADVAAASATIRARFPGALYNAQVLLREVAAPATVRGIGIAPAGSLLGISIDGAERLYLGSGLAWKDAEGNPLALDGLDPDDVPGGVGAVVRLLTLTVETRTSDGASLRWSRLGFAPNHPRWLGAVLAAQPPGRADAAGHPLWADIGSAVGGFELLAAVRALPRVAGDIEARRVLQLTGGSDGGAPVVGHQITEGSYAAAFEALSAQADVMTVATPGSSAYADEAAIRKALIQHAGAPGSWRIAIVEGPPQQSPGEILALRAAIDSSHAALYYPWVIVATAGSSSASSSAPSASGGANASAGVVLADAMPPSGFVAGLFARNDAERGAHKAPANLALAGALGVERAIDSAEFARLSPAGVNCLRAVEGRGLRLWGARLASADTEMPYVSDRRYRNYLEASIDRGTQWTKFENNADPLWVRMRQAVTAFLEREWQRGVLLGSTSDEAFFVRCDRTTMSEADLNTGRLVCLVGVAMHRPAEFVIFKLERQTPVRPVDSRF